MVILNIVLFIFVATVSYILVKEEDKKYADIDPYYVLMIAVIMVGFVALTSINLAPLYSFMITLFVSPLLISVSVDEKYRELPDNLTLIMTGSSFLFPLVFLIKGIPMGNFIITILIYVLLFFISFKFGSIGLGDIKLLFPILIVTTSLRCVYQFFLSIALICVLYLPIILMKKNDRIAAGTIIAFSLLLSIVLKYIFSLSLLI